MEQKERASLIFKSLSEFSCVTPRELSNYIKRTYHQDVTSAQIIGTLKKLEKEGKVAKSDCGIGNHYWVID